MLTLSLCTGDTGLPILWEDLGAKGNTNIPERIEIMERFTSFFGADRIKCLVCDREFVGKNWFSWLKDQNVSYVAAMCGDETLPTLPSRLKKNMILEIDDQKKRHDS